jgi:hypothetical protein
MLMKRLCAVFWVAALILAAALPVSAQQAPPATPEQRDVEQANLEFLLGRGYQELGQLRAQLAQARKDLGETRAKCGDRCSPVAAGEPAVTPK